MKKIFIYRKMLLGLIIPMTLLASCQVTKKYTAPEMNSENLFRDANPADTTSIASIPWKQYFKDIYLQAYIEEAIENNFDMLIATERIKQSEATLGMARSAYFPDIALGTRVTQDRLSNASPTTGLPKDKNVLGYHKETYSLGIVASWELDIWGKLRRQSKAKYAQMLNNHAGRNFIRTSLISSLANSYYSLLALDEQLRVTKDMIRLMEENLQTTEALKKAGMANGAAVEQTKATLYNTRSSIPDLENNIGQLENSICLLLGRSPQSIPRSALSDQIETTELTHGVPVQMLANRPDVVQAELSFRSAFELTQVARTSFYPSVNLTSGMIGFSTLNGLSQFFKPENFFANIIGELTLPIFARKQLATQLKIAKSEQQIALLSFEQTVLNAGREVSDILSTYNSVIRKNESRGQEVESLNKAVDYTRKLLKAGEATYLEVLAAQQGLLQARINQINDKLQQLQASSDLYRALGGGSGE